MIHGRYIEQGGDISKALQIRKEVFGEVNSEGLIYDTHDELDAMALNIVIDEDEKIIGAGRLILDLIEDKFYIDDICIKKEYRGKKYGDFIVRMIADKAGECLADCLWAEVPEYAKEFFQKEFFEEKGKTGDLCLMSADISSFKSCCGANECSSPSSDTKQVSLCGKDGGCAGCGGCGSDIKQGLYGGDRRYR